MIKLKSSIKMRNYHGEIDIAGIEFHIDLLIDSGFAFFMEILSDS